MGLGLPFLRRIYLISERTVGINTPTKVIFMIRKKKSSGNITLLYIKMGLFFKLFFCHLLLTYPHFPIPITIVNCFINPFLLCKANSSNFLACLIITVSTHQTPTSKAKI